MRAMKRLVLLLLCFGWSLPAAAAPHWLLIDTTARTLTVMQGETAVRRFDNISIGRDGASRTRFLGGEQTPLGTYRITSNRPSERYRRFLGIDYPSLQDALRARDLGKISEAALAAIRAAHEQGLEPPSNTPLGGQIGIHGLGSADPRVHDDYDWTDGCVALSNEQIDALAPFVSIGMTVIIL